MVPYDDLSKTRYLMLLRSDNQQEAQVIGQSCISPMYRASTVQYASRVHTEKSPNRSYAEVFPTFYFWSIKFLPEIVKAEEFMTYYKAVFIFHTLPVLMGLISVSAMITPQLASITGAWLSHPEPSHPFLHLVPITGPLKSIPCSQLNHTLQVSKCVAPS